MNARVVIINAVLFQLLWFVAVQGSDLWALFAMAVFFLIHSILFIRDQQTWLAIFLFGLIGWLADSAIANFGVVQYHGSYTAYSVTFGPLWLFSLWLCFASTLFFSLQWLTRYLWVSALLGLLVAPSSYLLGVKLSNSNLTVSWVTYYVIEGLVWSVLLPAMLYATEKLKQWQQRVSCYV